MGAALFCHPFDVVRVMMLVTVSVRMFMIMLMFLAHPLRRRRRFIAFLWSWWRWFFSYDSSDQPFEETSNHIYSLRVNVNVRMDITDFMSVLPLILTIPKSKTSHRTAGWST